MTRSLPLTALILACSGPQTPDSTTTQIASNLVCDWVIGEGPVVTHGDTTFETDRESIQFVDVDGAGDLDAVVFLGGCGNHADCEYVVVVACEDESYGSVWGPDYAQHVTVAPQPTGWGRLVVTQRVGEWGCDWPENTIYDFENGNWSESETCAPGFDREQWRAEECGPGPDAVCE